MSSIEFEIDTLIGTAFRPSNPNGSGVLFLSGWRSETIDEPQQGYSDELDNQGWRLDEHQYPDSVALQALRKFRGPVLLVNSADDRVIHRATHQAYRKAAGEHGALTYVEMKDAPHALVDLRMKSAFSVILQDWIMRSL